MSDLRSWACASPATRKAANTNEILSNMNGFFLVQTLHQCANCDNSAIHGIGVDSQARGDLRQIRLHLPARGLIGEDSPSLRHEPLRPKCGFHHSWYNLPFGNQ